MRKPYLRIAVTLGKRKYIRLPPFPSSNKENTFGWNIFKYPFSALRFFCSTNNKTFVGNTYTIDDCIGVGFSEEQKPKVFNCLINAVRRGRFHLAERLLQSSCLEYGTCYWKEMVYDNKKIPSYGKHWIDSKYKLEADRFKFQPQHSKNAYIELQCESLIEQNSTFVIVDNQSPTYLHHYWIKQQQLYF